jgi:hypothetical protein
MTMSPETSHRLVIEGGRGRFSDIDPDHPPDIPPLWIDRLPRIVELLILPGMIGMCPLLTW